MALGTQLERKFAVGPLPFYLVGLVLVLAGERIFASRPTLEVVLVSLGGLGVATATLIRLMPQGSQPRPSARIDQWLAWLTLGTALAVGLAVLVQHQPNWFGIRADLPTDVRDRKIGIWNIAWLTGLMVTLVPLLFAEAALYPMRKAPQPEERRVRAAAIAGLTLSLVALYGALFVYSGSKIGVAVDFSYFKTAKASESTKRIAHSLKDPVRVVALFPSISDVRTEVEHYLHDLSRGNPKLQVEFHDRLLEPKIAKELRASQDGTIILVRGEVRHIISVGTEAKNARAVLRNLDQEFQKNLMKIARDARVAYLSVGHAELNEKKDKEATNSGQGVQIFRKLLETQNFRIQDLGASQGLGQEIPADASVVFVLGPREPLAPEELGALDRYAKRGGHLFLALDSDGRPASGKRELPPAESKSDNSKTKHETNSTAEKIAATVAGIPSGVTGTNLEEIGAIVGVTVEPGSLANDRAYVQRRLDKSDYVQLITNRFSSHASVSTLSRNNAGVVLFGSGGLKKVDPNDNTVTFVAHSMPGTYIDENGDFELDGSESRGNFELAAAVSRPVVNNSAATPNKAPSKTEKSNELRAFVLGDADAVSDLVLTNAPSNRVLLLDAVRWLVGEESFAGEISSEEDVRIEHTKEKDVVWFYIVIFGAPAVVLALGLILARRSRSVGGRA